MNQRIYINPDEALCPDCDGGKRPSWRYSTCPTCGDHGTWAGTISELEKANSKISDLESELETLREQLAEMEESA